MIFKSKIYRRFLVTLLALSLLPMIALSWAALKKGETTIYRQSLLQLEISADAAEAMVYKYLDYLRRQTSALCSDRAILRAVNNHYRHPEDVKITGSLNRYLASGTLPAFHECVETLILDVRGRVIASSDASRVGKDLSQNDYFTNGQKSVYISDVFPDKESGGIDWVVSAPIMDKTNKKLLGVAANRINPRTLSDITTGRNTTAFGAKTTPQRKGETWETYIVNRDKLLITESRFIGDAILRQSVDTEIVRRSISEGEVRVANYPDYRGVPVFGVSMVIRDMGWIIVSEMDFAEARAPVRKAQVAISVGGCMLIIGIVVVAWTLALRMTRPISRLIQADRVSMQGDITHAFIPEKEIPADEMGDIMRSRNMMLAGVIENGKEVQESEERYRRLFNGSSDAVFVLSVSPDGKLGKFIDVNEAACKRLGYSREELLDMSPEDIDAPEMAGQRVEAVKQYCINGQVTFEMAHVTKDGRRIPVEIGVSYFEFREQPLAIAVARDITERKRFEELLLRQKEELDVIIDASPAMIFYKDTENRFIRVNKALAEAMGMAKEEIEGKTCFDLYPHDQADNYWKDDKVVIASGQQKADIIEPLETKKGIRWVQTDKVPYLDKMGKVIGIVGFAIDITEQRKAERSSAILYAVTKVLAESTSLEEAPPRVLQAVSEIIECEMSALWLVDYRTGALYCANTWRSPAIKPQEHEETCRKLANSVVFGGYLDDFTDVLVDDNFMSASVTVDNELHQAFCFPIISMEKTLGVMVFIGRTQTLAEKSIVDIMVTIGKKLGLFIKHREAEEQTRLQLQRVSALRDIDVAIAGSFDLKVSLNVFLEKAIALLHIDAADVLLLNPHMQTLEYVAGRGFRTNAIQRTSLRFGEGLSGRAALEGRLFSVANLSEKTNTFTRTELLADEQFVCQFCVPLTAKGQVKGVLEVFHRSPFDPDQEWLEFLEVLAGQCAIAVDNALMYGDLQRSHVELVMAYDSTLEGWSMALDLRDKETEGHTKRVTEVTLNLARAMDVDGGELAHIRRGALLHDIGKMGIPDNVLLKPGPLTDEEWIIMRMHPTFAYQMISHVAYLRQATDIPYCHHEKWDGTGYPRGLKGEQIPLAARIFAVVDVWDALRSDRPYRKGWPEEKVWEHIRSLSGTHFDPKVVEAFLKMEG